MRNISNNRGQIALVILVISAIIMTIGLSVSKKTVVETKITTDEEQLKQAFNAAESGIDNYLGTGRKTFTASDNKSEANVETGPVGGGSNIVNMGILTLRNNESYTWLVGHNTDGSINPGEYVGTTNLTLCVDVGFTGALKVDYFSQTGDGSYQVTRLGYNVVTANVVNGYTQLTNPATACPGFTGTRTISLDALPYTGMVPLLLAVKPIRGDTHIVVMATAGAQFPAQGEEIKSTGTAGDISGTSGVAVNRKVRVINQYFVPAFMLDAITGSGNVSPN
jgi:hypothetical protein